MLYCDKYTGRESIGLIEREIRLTICQSPPNRGRVLISGSSTLLKTPDNSCPLPSLALLYTDSQNCKFCIIRPLELMTFLILGIWVTPSSLPFSLVFEGSFISYDTCLLYFGIKVTISRSVSIVSISSHLQIFSCPCPGHSRSLEIRSLFIRSNSFCETIYRWTNNGLYYFLASSNPPWVLWTLFRAYCHLFLLFSSPVFIWKSESTIGVSLFISLIPSCSLYSLVLFGGQGPTGIADLVFFLDHIL